VKTSEPSCTAGAFAQLPVRPQALEHPLIRGAGAECLGQRERIALAALCDARLPVTFIPGCGAECQRSDTIGRGCLPVMPILSRAGPRALRYTACDCGAFQLVGKLAANRDRSSTPATYVGGNLQTTLGESRACL
jgi:hypothetical protein